MTSDELKKLLTDYKIVRSTLNAPCSDCYIQGYEEAVDLLWPLVEAIQIHHQRWAVTEYKDDDICLTECSSLCKALTDLEQKLKGG